MNRMDGGTTRAGSARTSLVLRQLHVLQEGNLHRNQRQFGSRRLLAVAALSLFVLAACNGNSTTSTTSNVIKIGILSDCLGDFGSFYTTTAARPPVPSPKTE